MPIRTVNHPAAAVHTFGVRHGQRLSCAGSVALRSRRARTTYLARDGKADSLVTQTDTGVQVCEDLQRWTLSALIRADTRSAITPAGRLGR